MIPFIIENFNEKRQYNREQTVAKTISSGEGEIYLVKIDNYDFLLSYITWLDATEEVRCDFIGNNDKPLSRLYHGLRLEIKKCSYQKHLYNYCYLRQARIRNSDTAWSNLYSASKAKINEGAGFDAITYLMSNGLIMIEKAGVVLSAVGSHCNDLLALFEQNNKIIPVNIFAITRILPILNNYYNDRQLNIFTCI